MAKIIYDSEINDLLELISKDMPVYVPAENDGPDIGQYVFRKWDAGVKPVLNYATTILPPKEFLMSTTETLFSFNEGKITAPPKSTQAIFGLSLEDLEGITKLDRIMKEPIIDEPYTTIRSKTYIIGLDKYSPPRNVEFDLYLQEFEPGVFAATAKTKQGKKWLSGKYFKNHQVNISVTKKKPDLLLSDPDLSRAIKSSAGGHIWKELSEICFGCGICSYVCPLCYCFETEDKIEFSNSACGERCRRWDSCMLRSFADTTHHNFRSELPDRIYNWYYHKFYRMPREQGFNGCVDCNRGTDSITN